MPQLNGVHRQIADDRIGVLLNRGTPLSGMLGISELFGFPFQQSRRALLERSGPAPFRSQRFPPSSTLLDRVDALTDLLPGFGGILPLRLKINDLAKYRV